MANCNKRETVVKGSDFRLRVHITNIGEGIHASDQNVALTCTVRVQDTSITKEKAQLTPIDDDTFIFPVATAGLKKGDVFLDTATSVPDTAFDDGTRYEIVTTDTGVTII